MKFSVFQVSRLGGRAKNEDRMGYSYTRESGVFVLADGMGGHPDGEVAAQLAIQTVSAHFQRLAKPKVGSVPEFLTGGLLAAHHQIMRYATEKSMLDSPRTTLVAALIEGGYVQWIHCGDSRLYVVRDGELLTRTRDHSFSEQQAQLGKAAAHLEFNRNVLFTCLGSPQRPIYDLSTPLALQQGDKVLMCSDGLWGSIPDEEIVSVLATAAVSDAVPELAERALRKAGATSDNVTILALEWETPDAFESTHGITTDSISDGEFQTTIQRGEGGEGDFADFDEEDIERSIAEINEAIRKTAAKKP